jgi:ribosomal protein L7/L12
MLFNQKRAALDSALDMLNSPTVLADKEWHETAQKMARVLFERIVPPPTNYNELTDSEWDYLEKREKIPCIKSVRTRTGWGLKEAKDFVEAKMQTRWGYTSFPLNY